MTFRLACGRLLAPAWMLLALSIGLIGDGSGGATRGRARSRGRADGAVRRLSSGKLRVDARARAGRHAAQRDRRGLPGRAGARAGLAHRERTLEGHDRRVSRPRIHAGGLPDRDREEPTARAASPRELRRRRRTSASCTTSWCSRASRLLTQTAFNLDMTAKIVGANVRPDRHADRGRGAGHRLARARRQLGAALRQQVHRLHVDGDDRRHRAFQRAGHRPCRRCTSWRSCTPISARPIATPSSRRCRTARSSSSTSPSRRARRCCRRRPPRRPRRSVRSLPPQGELVATPAFSGDRPAGDRVRRAASSRARPTRSTGTRSSATA